MTEQCHQLLKGTLNLAHLSSSSQTGIESLLYIALLLAMILFLFANVARREVPDILFDQLHQLRRAHGLGYTWQRNMNSRKRSKTFRKWKRRQLKGCSNL